MTDYSLIKVWWMTDYSLIKVWWMADYSLIKVWWTPKIVQKSSGEWNSIAVRLTITMVCFPYRSPIILLSFSYRSPIVLLSFSYRSPIGKRKTIRKQYGMERRMNGGWTNEDRWNKGGASYFYLSNFLLQWQESKDFQMPCCHSIHIKKHRTSQNRFVRRIIFIGSKTND